jgi:hypothetical protein
LVLRLLGFLSASFKHAHSRSIHFLDLLLRSCRQTHFKVCRQAGRLYFWKVILAKRASQLNHSVNSQRLLLVSAEDQHLTKCRVINALSEDAGHAQCFLPLLIASACRPDPKCHPMALRMLTHLQGTNAQCQRLCAATSAW